MVGEVIVVHIVNLEKRGVLTPFHLQNMAIQVTGTTIRPFMEHYLGVLRRQRQLISPLE